MDPAQSLVQRADDEAPGLLHQLADPGGRGGWPVRTGAERRRGGRPGKLDQFGRIVRHLDQTVGQSLLESKLAQ